ncbi:MAG: F0F1 ATP synthase subunit A [Anaerolineales bacterium]|nr:F0F1 ATP synthase subunit A [Anaerolineales bacterium]
MEQEKRRPWRRWVVLVLMIAGFILGGIFVPVQPEITVAAEKLILEPISENFLGFAGPFYLVNTLPTLAVTLVLLIVIAFFTNRSLKNSQNTDLVPRGIGNVMEAILEMLYNLTEGSAGKYAKMIFPWFATIMIYVLFANLLKLIPGFESIGVLHPHGGEHAASELHGWHLYNPELSKEYVLAPFFPRYFSGFELHRVAGFDLGGDDPGDRFPRAGTWLFE